MTSIKDIAARAKVSIGTVDRVLHNRGRVSDQTRSRVQRIVRQLGYRPNMYARNLSLDKMYRFAVLMPRHSQDSEYWRIPVKGVARACRELAMHRVRVAYCLFDRYSERSFERAFGEALHLRPDGLLIAPVLSRKSEELVATIPQGVPFVFFDSTIPGSDCLTFIGQDPFQSGLLASNLLQGVARVDGSVVIVKVVPEDFHINERIRGFLTGFRGSRAASVKVVEVESQGGEAAFEKVLNDVLAMHVPLQGVFVSNAWTHPVARFVHSHSRLQGASVVGYDLVPKNLHYLKKGYIDFLISQRPEMQGYEGIYSLYEHVALRETVKQKIMVPIDIVTKDNVKYYQG